MNPEYQSLLSARRKTLSIQVRDGQVIVRAPERASQAVVEAFVQSRREWIHRHQQRQQNEIEALRICLHQGGAVPWNGEMLALNWKRGSASGVERGVGSIHVTLSHRVRRNETDAVAEQLRRWFSSQAEELLIARTHEISARTGLVPTEIGIGNWRGRWGQCSSRGEVKLNWRLLHLPAELQDYVILHELCHLRYLNHGPSFHALMLQHCKEHRNLYRKMQRYTSWLRW